MDSKISARITPLWVVAAFVTLTETVLGYAVTKVTGNVQIALTSFVIVFALLVAGGFFLILWNRPYVFYPPSEYTSIDPARFIDALRSALPKKVSEQLKLAADVQKRSLDEEALFALVDSFIEHNFRQHLILMHEFKQAIPYSDSRGHKYAYEMGTIASGEGVFGVDEFVEQLEATGFIELSPKGPVVKLTDLGHGFAEWLGRHNRKATYFVSPFGQWGTPKPGGFFEQRQKKASQKAETQ
ncbi:MAG: hypothetical protein ACREQA_22300 [Candidatus Binatia bacterium]